MEIPAGQNERFINDENVNNNLNNQNSLTSRVVVTQPPQDPSISFKTKCYNCNRDVQTRIEKVFNCADCCFCLCFSLFWCCYKICSNKQIDCNDVEHKCPECKVLIYRYSSC